MRRPDRITNETAGRLFELQQLKTTCAKNVQVGYGTSWEGQMPYDALGNGTSSWGGQEKGKADAEMVG